jgi:hypothetical protein
VLTSSPAFRALADRVVELPAPAAAEEEGAR